ncbi:MAG TPA: KH domain-containing protein [Candidatus Baltobacteraceae bacterium]|jgi:hypothetical protein|nr:KH domain-containing protein [Candidatus Baltobacteraceae bacterium]
MSAFDDEFGLFGDETEGEDERRSTLGARRISEGEAVQDEIEPEDESVPRRTRGLRGGETAPVHRESGAHPVRRRAPAGPRTSLGDEVLYPRAADLLTFLAKGLVANPDSVAVHIRSNERGGVLALEVDPEDLGKVIGRGGRVAQALRTLIRAGAEGRVTVDIVDVDRGTPAAGSHEEDAASQTHADQEENNAQV